MHNYVNFVIMDYFQMFELILDRNVDYTEVNYF